MSGRVRTTLSDGRRVTGFRKTLRRNPRRPGIEPCDWTLTIWPQGHGLLCLPPGQTSVVGVTVLVNGFVVAKGKSRAWVLRQMADYLAGFGIITDLPPPKRVRA